MNFQLFFYFLKFLAFHLVISTDQLIRLKPAESNPPNYPRHMVLQGTMLSRAPQLLKPLKESVQLTASIPQFKNSIALS